MRLTLYERIRSVVPKPVKVALQPVLGLVTDKYSSELGYWKARHRTEGFDNRHYRGLMLAMARETDESFLAGKTVADFGCGPKGSLCWLQGAEAKIGIDVLAARYADAFPEAIRSHDMIYVTATEAVIPMPTASVDVMFTLNALDHAADLPAMSREIVRVLKPSGEFIGSFNLNEPCTVAEPLTLDEALLDRELLCRFTETSRRLGRFGPAGAEYQEMFDGVSTYRPGERGYMWYRGTKRPQ
jgi:SAM-dependent methyltransferase